MTTTKTTVTRFAPSPTGYLHLGHAHGALFAEAMARRWGGRFLLRVEDIDRGRCRPEFETALFEDLGWLGLVWEEPVRRQSEHLEEYAHALSLLHGRGHLYPCFCTRKDILAEVERAGGAPHGPEGVLYPGLCRGLDLAERERRMDQGAEFALRLDVGRALAEVGDLSWHDRDAGRIPADPAMFGDVVLARKEIPTSYHLAVTLDDHVQGVTLVTRGEDLFNATHVHRLLQALLGLRTPEYHHHRLLMGPDGRRLAKRDRSLTLRSLREQGCSPAEARRLAGWIDDEPRRVVTGP